MAGNEELKLILLCDFVKTRMHPFSRARNLNEFMSSAFPMSKTI